MRHELDALLRKRRAVVLVSLDCIAWLVALLTFASLRMDLADEPVPWVGTLGLAGLAAVLHVQIGWIVRLHQGRCMLGSFEDMLVLGAVTGAAGMLVGTVNLLAPEMLVPRSVPVAATFMALALGAAGRAVWRWLRELGIIRRHRPGCLPALILGAGDGGRQLVDSMLRDPGSGWFPIGLLDDDRQLRHLRIRGVPVLGTSEDLASVLSQTGCRTLIVAIPSAGSDLIRTIGRRAIDLGIELKVVPGVRDLLDGRVAVADIRDIEPADLLGRHQVDTEIASVAGCLTGRRVLVTGAGGSIGSELCRQIKQFAPAELIMVDHDESALHAVQLAVNGMALLDTPDVVLADIRDAPRMMELFQQRRPEVVFHAAALKHLPMLEQYPVEAVKTNVWGTFAVLEAAKAADVERFVNISTDKAANPSSVLGYSKRIAEGLTAAAARDTHGSFVSVRFGNVLGSRGSVLTAFTAQIEAGGPVTVTHPDVTRYFMTVQEAVQLVIQAAAIGKGGEALVLDMGEPVGIADVARQLIELSGRHIEIVFTGLREGEKLHEELLGSGERDHRPMHPSVSHVSVPPVPPPAVRKIDTEGGRQAAISALRATCMQMVDGDRALSDVSTDSTCTAPVLSG
ncbi:nucleoside-diphosphate sugar epimerase/dehydratase [Actinopolymorpha sp. B17G11]|uniref:polysaccharide biosynthesis protein n=1 Tax=Actinopolymorpha sp. B17G11 TaxID=3160861 RepID=UPI0032E4DD9D